MTFEPLAIATVKPLTELALELWPDCTFDEEYDYYTSVVKAENEISYLVREQDQYIAFIHLTIRTDYVEGATGPPVAYLEAIYVKPAYQKRGIGRELVRMGQDWGKRNGCRHFASDAELTNAASIDFHRKAGFTEANRIVCFIKDL
ncbi:aminoglycoside 6'-N-acetyltransferase [Larkinella humicola]|uniref:Aminoglycoside N(6')-acetyltransferase type 1 n=1 Tax=Larkinella humicola TaxID=2607654 RepID=A0A5N1J911_9BACT|nr:aminoglycoside 6'-N-acetyltransferase [Larkinella humicola]KAA9347965.1 GNAT family N-acetyltransferase [Larkinella humicola]